MRKGKKPIEWFLEARFGMFIHWGLYAIPAYGDCHHPMRDNEEYKNVKYDFNRYLDYMHKQVCELCSNNGKIDIMWFDFSYDDMSGDGCGSIKTSNPSIYSGDFASPEQVIPPQGITDDNCNAIPWEACITMNNHWGYCSTDKMFKSSKLIIRKLVECVSKNGKEYPDYAFINFGPNSMFTYPLPDDIDTVAEFEIY